MYMYIYIYNIYLIALWKKTRNLHNTLNEYTGKYLYINDIYACSTNVKIQSLIRTLILL